MDAVPGVAGAQHLRWRVNAEDEQQSEGIVLYEEGGKPEYTEAEAESEVYSETETAD